MKESKKEKSNLSLKTERTGKKSSTLLLIHNLPVHPRLEPVVLRKPFCILLVNGLAVKRNQILRIKRIRRAAGKDCEGAFVEFDFHCACDPFLGLVDKGVEVGKEGVVDQAGVGHFGPLLFDDFLEFQFAAGEDEFFEVCVGGKEDGCSGVFVVFAGFKTKDAVFDHICPADTVFACNSVQFLD